MSDDTPKPLNDAKELRMEIELLKEKINKIQDPIHIQNKSKMKKGQAVGGVILLAIGLMMVVGGGAAVLTSMCLGQPYGSCRSDFITLIGGSIVFWIGMVPTIFGVRVIAKA